MDRLLPERAALSGRRAPAILSAGHPGYMDEQDYGCKHCLPQNPACQVTCTYAYLMGIPGAAFFLSWKQGWHGDNAAIFSMSDDAEAPERWAFEAIGYRFEWIVKEKGCDNWRGGQCETSHRMGKDHDP